jgi:hypothetical protein
MMAQSPGYHDSLLVVLAEKRAQRGKSYEKRLPAYLEACVTVLDLTWHQTGESGRQPEQALSEFPLRLSRS